MSKLAKSFRSLKPFKALVLGDFFIDTYTTGRVKRISPEAPVQVLEIMQQESKPGGAGNATKNIAVLGAEVIAIGRIGSGELPYGIDATYLIREPDYKTPVKNRFIANGQQLLRVDAEAITPLHKDLEPLVIEHLRNLIPTVGVVAISDYGKGFLTTPILTAAIQMARDAAVPLIVDPKGTDFTKYRHATVLKPNLSEAYAASGLPSSATLDEVAGALLEITNVQFLLITRSEAGISLFESGGKRTDFPVHSKEVKDVTGAGDTVLAMISAALANGLDIDVATQLANIAAGIAIERFGCVQVTLPEIGGRLLEDDVGCKIFDRTQVLENRKSTLLVLGDAQEMTGALLRAIRQLAQNLLLVYIQGNNPSDEFVYLLSLLKEVDFIVLESEHLQDFQPHEVYTFKQGQLKARDVGKGILAQLLGQMSTP